MISWTSVAMPDINRKTQFQKCEFEKGMPKTKYDFKIEAGYIKLVHHAHNKLG